MKKFVILTYGFEQPTKQIMNAWGAWFGSIGDKMVDMGGPFGGGKEISRTGDRDLPLGKESLTGYVVINAESLSEAETVARNCPMIHSVQVYETMEMG